MGYDVYLSFTADVPDEETGERLREAFFTSDNFGPTLYVESVDTSIYGSWEGRNRDEHTVTAWLQALADQFQVTFDVHYESDYNDAPRHFFVGVDAAVHEASYCLEQLDHILERLNQQDDVIQTVIDQFADGGEHLRAQLTHLLTQFNTQ